MHALEINLEIRVTQSGELTLLRFNWDSVSDILIASTLCPVFRRGSAMVWVSDLSKF